MISQNKYRCFSSINLFLLFSFVALFPFLSKSQPVPESDLHKFNLTYITSYWHDGKIIVSEPFRWKAKQWSVFAGVVSVSVVAYVYDKEIYDFFQRNRNETTDVISNYAIEPWGSGLYSLPLLAGIYFTGIKNDRHRNVALTGLKAFLISAGASEVSKYLFHRHRPGEDDPPNPYLWEGPFVITSDYTSFPSGHTTTAFALASVLAQGYKDKLWIGLTAYTVASLVGVSRIYDGKHWATDVLAGAALGTFIGTTLSKINFAENSKIAINPVPINGGYGVSVAYRFD